MSGKPITEQGLDKDLAYILNGTDVSEVLLAIQPPRVGLSVLEPGCGSGKLGMGYWVGGCDVTLIDIDPGVLQYTRALEARLLKIWQPGQGQKLTILQGSIFDLTSACQYDLVYSEGVPHHFPQSDPRRQEAIARMALACKPGGTVCVIGSNAHCPAMMSYAEKVDHTYLGMPPRQEPFTAVELAGRLGWAGLIDIKCEPIGAGWGDSMLLAGWGRKP